jgi:hypothetical protein
VTYPGWMMLAGALWLAACTGRPVGDKSRGTGSRAPGSETGMMSTQGLDSGGMPMGGMPMGGMLGTGLMTAMRSQMDSIAGMSPAQMQARMAAHGALASRMMDAMGADIRRSHMTPGAGWSALSDSVRQDLAELPALSGAALGTRMRAHLDRMRRLMGQHESMMK